MNSQPLRLQMTVSLKTEISCEDIVKLLFWGFFVCFKKWKVILFWKIDWILYVVPLSDFLPDLSCFMQIGKASIKD